MTGIAEFQRLADLLPEAMLLVGLDASIAAANRSASGFLRVAPGSLAGTNLSDLAGDDRESLAAFLTACSRSDRLGSANLALRSGAAEIACRLEGALFAPPTPVAPALLLLRLFRADDASLPVEFTQQIDELAQEVTRRREAEAALVDANRRKDEFLAMLAHELRNPLAPLRNGVELMEAAATKEGYLSGAGARSVVGIMKRQVGQLTRMVDDLMDVARITHGRLKIVQQPIAFLSVLERAIETVGPAILDKGQKFVKTLPSASIVVDADLARLSQVFVNLLSNATKFTKPGGTITLVTQSEEDHVLVRIIDDGAGIAPELMQSLFEPFVQADKSLARSLSGLGIGLSVANSLVSQHGGELNVSSNGIGQGSEFIVRLPARVEQPVADGVETGRAAVAAGPDNPMRRKILIVDDNIDAAESLSMLLGIANHDVRTAHNPEAALEALNLFAPDVILLDIGLPGMDGFQLARVIRSRPDTAGVVMAALTGYGKEEDRMRSAEAGFNAHFTKPVEYEALDWLLNPGTRPLQ